MKKLKKCLILKYLFAGVLFSLCIACLTGCGDEKKIAKAQDVILQKLQESYAIEFEINDIYANKGSFIRGIKSYNGHAYPKSDPTQVFSFNLTSNYQILKEEYLCVQLARELDSKVRSEGKINESDYKIHTVVYSEKQLIGTEINIAPETVLNNGTIHYSIYLIKEATSINPQEEADTLTEYISNLGSISFDGIMYTYYVKPNTTAKVIQAIDGKIRPVAVKSDIINSCTISCNKELQDTSGVIEQLTK